MPLKNEGGKKNSDYDTGGTPIITKIIIMIML